MRFLEIMGAASDARLGAKDAVLAIEAHDDKVLRHEGAIAQFDLHMASERAKLKAEREAVEAELAEQRASLQEEIAAFETVKAAVAADREYVRSFIREAREQLGRLPQEPWPLPQAA